MADGREPPPNLETLRDDGELFVYRTLRAGTPLIVARPSAAEIAAATVGKLENALALRDLLAPSFAARPLVIEHHGTTPTLILEDPGGELVARRLGRPWELGALLRVAVGAASALRELHARGVIHQDIKPAHLLATVDGEVRLLGFGLAARLPPHGTLRRSANVAAGTLAYMAPEQTGRVDWPIDARSDLYSLGATLYELATGAPPFS